MRARPLLGFCGFALLSPFVACGSSEGRVGSCETAGQCREVTAKQCGASATFRVGVRCEDSGFPFHCAEEEDTFYPTSACDGQCGCEPGVDAGAIPGAGGADGAGGATSEPPDASDVTAAGADAGVSSTNGGQGGSSGTDAGTPDAPSTCVEDDLCERQSDGKTIEVCGECADCGSCPADLLAYFPLDGSGVTADLFDHSGLGNHAQLNVGDVGAGQLVDGVRGAALNWSSDGAPAPYAQVDTEQVRTLAWPMTLSLWIRSDAFAPDLETVVSNADTNDGPGFTLRADFFAGVVRAQGAGVTLSGSNALNLEWNHIVLVADGATGTVHLYANGAELQSTDQWMFEASGQPLRFGALAETQFHDYSIDEVKVFQRALTPEEVMAENASLR